MFKKLMHGEYSLAASFWKFGVLGLLVGYIVLYVIERLLYANLGGITLLRFYTNNFSILHLNTKILLLTGMHLISLALYLVYSIMVFLGVWRASKNYEKSSWLSGMARIFIILIIAIGLNCAF